MTPRILGVVLLALSLSACSGGRAIPPTLQSSASSSGNSKNLCSPSDSSRLSAEAIGTLVVKTNSFNNRIVREIESATTENRPIDFEFFCDLELEIAEHQQELEDLMLQELRFSTGFEQLDFLWSQGVAYVLLAQRLCAL